MFNGGTRLRDIANAGEDARRALERAGLDYCCEGRRTLGEACAAAGIEVELLEAELRRVNSAAPQDWSPSGISAVLDCVLDVLSSTHQAPPGGRKERGRVARCAGPSVRVLAEALDALDEVVSKQMCEEEECLFARVRALAEARMGHRPYPAPSSARSTSTETACAKGTSRHTLGFAVYPSTSRALVVPTRTTCGSACGRP